MVFCIAVIILGITSQSDIKALTLSSTAILLSLVLANNEILLPL
jgi:hypothetical protein